MTTLPIETRTAAWKPPTLTKSLARTVAKRLDKHWAQTGVKSLKDIRSALGSGIAAGMSMRDRIDHQAAIQKWTASLSKDDLHKVFRMIEEIKNGKAREQYRMTDDALNRLRAASGLLPSERFASEQRAEKLEAEAEANEAQADADRQKADAARMKAAAGLGPVAKTILDQMGGNRVLAMLGVNRLQDLRNGIGIGWPNRQRSKGNYVEIRLNGKDLYDMTFYNLSMRGKKKVKEFKDLYNDALADTFEGQTGWYLRMASEEGKTAAGGLYGYTKGTQRDVEASVRKAQRRAASVAKTLYAKDERSVDFLKVHAKRANSKTARLILAAMKNIGPRVASEMLPSERHASIWEGSEKEQLAYVLDALRLAKGKGVRMDDFPIKGARAAQREGLAEAERGRLYMTPKGYSTRTAAEEKVAGGLYGHPTKTARLALVACSDLRAYVGEVAYSLHSRRTAKYAKMTGFLKEHGKTAKCAYSRMILDCYPDSPVSKQAKEKYPWDECIADQEKQYGSKETAEKVCGKIKAQSQGKSAATKITDREYDALRPGKRIFLGVSGGFMQSGEKEFEVGRTSYSKKYDVYSKTLYPVDEEGNAVKKGRAKWTLFKRPTGVSLGHGGMGTVIKSFRTASTSDQMLKKAFVPDSVDGWLEWEDGTRTAATRRRG